MKRKITCLTLLLFPLLASADGGTRAFGSLINMIMGLLYLGTFVSFYILIHLFKKKTKSAKKKVLILSLLLSFFGIIITLFSAPHPGSYPEDDKKVRLAGLSILIPNILMIAIAPWVKTRRKPPKSAVE